MTIITRPGTEELKVENCPVCDSEVRVTDCGYSSFNPGTASCLGKCKSKWALGYVYDQWQAGLIWNREAIKIRRKLEILKHIVVCDGNKEIKKEANQLLEELRTQIIGAKK